MELDVYKEWLGIPDGPRPPDQYELLRLVRFEDSIDKVRKKLQEAQHSRPQVCERTVRCYFAEFA